MDPGFRRDDSGVTTASSKPINSQSRNPAAHSRLNRLTSAWHMNMAEDISFITAHARIRTPRNVFLVSGRLPEATLLFPAVSRRKVLVAAVVNALAGFLMPGRLTTRGPSVAAVGSDLRIRVIAVQPGNTVLSFGRRSRAPFDKLAETWQPLPKTLSPEQR